MKLIAFLCLLAAFYSLPLLHCLAQNEHSAISTESHFISLLSGTASADGSYSLFFYQDEARNFFSFNEQGALVSSLVYPYPARIQQERPLGIHETSSAFHYFFRSSTHRRSLEIISIGKKKAAHSITLLPLTTNRHDQFLQSIQLNGKMFFLLLNRREDKLIVVKALDGKRLERHEFVLSKEVVRAFGKTYFESINTDRETPFNELQLAKAYLPEKDRLILTKELSSFKGETEKGLTAVLQLNLALDESLFTLVPGPAGVAGKIHTNTFLLDEVFMKVAAGRDFFNLSFFSFPALNEEKSFFYLDSTEISLIERKLEKREGNEKASYVERKERKEILGSLNKGTLAVQARNPDGQNLQLRIGSFGFLQSDIFSLLMPPMGIFYNPGEPGGMSQNYGEHATHGSAPAFSCSFETSFNADYFEPSFAPAQASMEEKERRFIESLEPGPDDRLLHLPVSFSKSFIAHFNSREKLFTVYLLTAGDSYKASWEGPKTPNGF